jgi:serine/threonine protein kinase
VLENEQPLYATALSDVFRGIYGEKTVAVKSLRVYTDEHHIKSVQKASGYSRLYTHMTHSPDKQAFLNEVITWKHLRHPNIVPFLGVCDKSLVCLVSEWMAEGTLAGFLQRHPNEHRTSYVSANEAVTEHAL